MPAAGQYLKKCKRGHLREGDNLLITSNNQRICRQCHKIRHEAYVASEHGQTERKKAAVKYRETNRSRIRERSRLRTKKAQEFINMIKQGPCMDCGNTFPTCAMDLDHVKGEKKDDISGLIGSGSTLRILMEEVDKCELVCANCHRVRTYNRRKQNAS
jgi:hypothetical protein